MPVIEAREPTVFVISMKEILRVGAVIEAVFVLSDSRALLIWRRGWNVTPNVEVSGLRGFLRRSARLLG